MNNLIRIILDFPKPGIIFKDITPLVADPAAFKSCCEDFAKLAASVDYIAGVEARGFILASAVAVLSGKGFIPIRKSGKLPGQVFSQQSLKVSASASNGVISLKIIPGFGKSAIIRIRSIFISSTRASY